MKRYQKNDEELVALYIAGNEACMDMLINRYKTKVFTAIHLVVNDRYIAEDIFQETSCVSFTPYKKGSTKKLVNFYLGWFV